MSRFPSHLSMLPASRSTSFHQENIGDDENAGPQPLYKSTKNQVGIRSLSGGPSLIGSFNNSIPNVKSFRDQDVKQSVQDWIRHENNKDKFALKYTIESLRNSWRLRQDTEITPLRLLSIATRVPSLATTPDIPVDETKVDEEEELDPEDDSLDLDEDQTQLMALSGTAGIRPSLVPDDYNDEFELTTAQSRLPEDNESLQELDPRYSILAPYETYFKVIPPMLGEKLAPPGTTLDLSSVEPTPCRAFPLSYADDSLLSNDELKLFAILNHELQQEGSIGLDLDGLIPEVEQKTSDTKKSGLFNRLFGWRDDERKADRYAQKNAWYLLSRKIDSLDLDDKENRTHDDMNREMIPMNYHGEIDFGGCEDKQRVHYVPAHGMGRF